MNNDPLSTTLLVLSVSTHLFLIEVVAIGEIYLCYFGTENVSDNGSLIKQHCHIHY